jgi:hypothetical protein
MQESRDDEFIPDRVHRQSFLARSSRLKELKRVCHRKSSLLRPYASRSAGRAFRYREASSVLQRGLARAAIRELATRDDLRPG